MKKPMRTYDEPAPVRDEHQDARDAIGCTCDWTPVSGNLHRFKCGAVGGTPLRLTADRVDDAEANYVAALAALRAAVASRAATDTPETRRAIADALAAVRVAAEPLDAATRMRLYRAP